LGRVRDPLIRHGSLHRVEYLPDAQVTSSDDRDLRELLAACFNPVASRVFAERRYLHEPPAHRWLIRNGGRIVSHAACHDKRVATSEGELRVAGVAEVATREPFRRQGMAESILVALHAWAQEHGFVGAMLFGDHAVYAKLGYGTFERSVRHFDHRDQAYKVVSRAVRYLAFTGTSLPQGLLDIRCPFF